MVKFSLIIFIFCSSLTYGALDLEGILKRVDDIRNPAESYVMRVEIVNSDNPHEPGIYEVDISGNNKTLIKTLSPASEAGKKYLMLNEDMWAYTPNLSRAVRVSLSQRLSGQTANGDIGRMRWSGDYSPKLEAENSKEWTLFLTAKKKKLTYEKVRVWVNKSNYFPVKAEFLSLQGKALKYASYKGFKKIAGRVRPTQITIRDANVQSDYSIIYVKSMKPRSFPASVFNQNSLE